MPAHVAVCFLIEPLVLYMSQTSSAVVSSHLPTPSLPLLLITGSIVTIQTPGSMASEASVTDETVTEINTNVSDDISNAYEMSASEPEDPKVKDVEEKKIETNVSGDVSNADDMSLSETDDLKGKDEEEKKFETNVPDDASNANEANPAKPEDLEVKDGEEKIETKVSDDVSNADEPSLSKPEDLKGNDEKEKIETSVSDDISNADEAISNPDDLKGKDEEEKAVQDSASVEAPTAETEENLEQKEEGTVIEVVKEAAIDESVSEPSVEAEEKDAMGKTDVPNTPESPMEPVEQPAEVSDASVTEDSIETPEEPSVSEIVTEEAKSIEESSEVFSVPDSLLVTHDKPVELPPVGLVQEPGPDSNVTLNANETAEKSQEGESTSQELPQNEISSSSTEDPINQVHETVEMVSTESIAIVPSVYEHKEIEAENIVPELSTEKIDDDHNADEGNKESAEEKEVSATCVVKVSDTTPATEVPECAVEPEVTVKNEEQDSTVNVENEVAGNSEEVKASDCVGLIGEVKNENLESKNLNLYKNTRNIDLVEAEDSNKASSIDPLVTDDKPVEPPTVGLVQEPAPDSNVTLNAKETAEKSQEGEPMSQELPRNETSLSGTEDPINQVNETVEMVSSEGIDIVPSIDENKEIEGENIVPKLSTEKANDDHNADEHNKESAEEKEVSVTCVVEASDTTPATEVPECAVEPEVTVKNVEQDNTVNVENEVAGNSEEVKASDGVGLIGEVRNESLEGVNLNLYKNTRNINSVEAEDSNKASSIDPLGTDDKPVELPTVGLVQEPAPDANVILSADETAEKTQEGDPTSQELPRNETSPPITEDPISKVHETVEVESSEGIAIVPCIGEPKEFEEENIVPELPTEKTDDDHNADEGNKESAEEKGVSDTSVVKVSDTTAATEVPECAVQREVDVKNEEKETTLNVENVVAGNTEEENTSEGVGFIGEVKNESLEGGNSNSNNNTREIDLFGVEDSNNASSIDPEHDPKELDTELKQAARQTLLHKMLEESAEDKKKETKKVDNQSLAQNTKDNSDSKTDGEVPKTDVSGKKSQSPQNSILSKVKKSIAKVKKAITGKSPSLKTMITEGINDTKDK
ncbi:uncharacterized protein LOC103997168 isoform X2 [Musa acuminata AAA Group]|uniref:uncharacterized protein LOC103997168 isoform X2 n=1 Tax=Musa acuminata AAA Group TaxID=214697 RepID=UPI0031E3B54E